MITLKLIKTTPFEYEGVKYVAYVAAYNGQAFNVSSMHFEDADLIADDKAKTLKIKADVEIHKEPFLKDIVSGEMGMGFRLKVRMDLPVANWKAA